MMLKLILEEKGVWLWK